MAIDVRKEIEEALFILSGENQEISNLFKSYDECFIDWILNSSYDSRNCADAFKDKIASAIPQINVAYVLLDKYEDEIRTEMNMTVNSKI